MPSTTHPTSAHRVLETAELLEQILLEVNDYKTILLSQRVHSAFKRTILTSPKLRQLLWLSPPAATTTDRAAAFIVNPFLGSYDFETPYTMPLEICIDVRDERVSSWRKMIVFRTGDRLKDCVQLDLWGCKGLVRFSLGPGMSVSGEDLVVAAELGDEAARDEILPSERLLEE